MAGNTTLSAKSWSNMLVHSTLYSTLFTALPLRRTCQVQLQLQINSIIFCKFLTTVHVYNQCTFQPALCFQCSIYSNKVTKSQICPKQISAKPVNRSQTCIDCLLHGHCLRMALKQWSMHSSRADWTTATLCFQVWATVLSSGCSRSRTRQHVLSPALVDVSTSRRCWGVFTGCRCVSAFATSSWRLCTVHYRVKHRSTSSMTASLCLTLVGVPSGRRNGVFVWYRAATARSATDRLRLPAHVYGTAFPPRFATYHWQFTLLANILKLICFLVERGHGAFVTFMISLRRIQMFLLTYLLIEGFWFEIERCICYNTILAVAGYPAIARYHRR